MLNLNPSEQAEIAAIAAKQQIEIRRKLSANRNVVFAVNLIRTVHEQIDSLVAKIKRNPGVKFDCQKGCSYCCTLRIEVIVPEVFLIARELKKLPPAQFQELIAKLEKHAEAASGVLMENFFLQCPFLQDNACSIYPIRPAMCRKYCSLDVEVCKNPDASAPENMELFAKASALLYGTTEAYGSAKLSSRSHEFGQALLRALTDNTAEQRWYRGESVFEPIPEQGRYTP